MSRYSQRDLALRWWLAGCRDTGDQTTRRDQIKFFFFTYGHRFEKPLGVEKSSLAEEMNQMCGPAAYHRNNSEQT